MLTRPTVQPLFRPVMHPFRASGIVADQLNRRCVQADMAASNPQQYAADTYQYAKDAVANTLGGTETGRAAGDSLNSAQQTAGSYANQAGREVLLPCPRLLHSKRTAATGAAEGRRSRDGSTP